jgi:hypothetical protein
MERNFPVESKSFSISVLEGASTMRVEEKRKNFFGVIILSTQCSDWLASTLETLLDFPEVQDFVKSFREGSKLVIARRGENKAGQFLEAAVYGLGGRKGFLLIPEGRRGWGWRKFSSELRLVSASLSASVDRGIISSNASVKQKGPSYAVVLWSALDSVAKELTFEGGHLPRLRAPLAEPRALDLFPALRSVVPEVPRTTVDCSILEFPLVDSLVMDKSRCPPGKQQAPVRCSPSNPTDLGSLLYPLGKRKKSHASHSIRGAIPGNLNSNLHTWFQMFLGFNLAMGQTIGKILGHAAGPVWALSAEGLGWDGSSRNPNL